MDVKTTFLNEMLEVDIYMDQLEVSYKRGREHLMYKLKKVLYGLKQSRRVWYHRIDFSSLQIGFWIGF